MADGHGVSGHESPIRQRLPRREGSIRHGVPRHELDSRQSMQHPYADFVHLVAKPARYVGGEHGARPKNWDGVKARVCLAFPDVYDIGMSHLGFKILYKILNDDPRTLAERAYCPWVDMDSGASQAERAARVARERAAAPRLRRRRLLSSVRAHVHERSDDARPRRNSAALERSRRTTIRSSSREVPPRRIPSRSARSSMRS